MTPKQSLKELSIAQLQEAFSRALTELAGRECSVVVNELKFEVSGAKAWQGIDAASFSGSFETKPKYSEGFGEELPLGST